MSYKAFVSSTFIDLEDHRAVVIDALAKAGIFVDPMEKWTADSDAPKTVSTERMRDCDLCVLLVAARRGHVPEGETLSVTQMEYQEAVRRGIDVLAFLYDGESAWPPDFVELKEDEALVEWRAELFENYCVGTVTHDPDSLASPVRDALARWIQQQAWPEVHKNYLETLRDAHGSIRFLGIGQYRDIAGRPIDELFVEPRIAPQHIPADRPLDQWPETTPLLKILGEKKRLVLLGDPGSGKSTLVNWIVWNLASEDANPWKDALDGRTPFVLILRDLNLEDVDSWDALLKAYYRDLTARPLGRSRYAEDIRALFESGQAMVILDGIDEVGNPKTQERLRQAVQEGMERYADCAWLMTSRLIGYANFHRKPTAEREVQEVGEAGVDEVSIARLREHAEQRDRDLADLYYVAPFADDQIEQFARNWFAMRDASQLRAQKEADELVEAIHSNPYTLRLARTPNLLTMMALIHRERAHLPHGRALLYSDIATAYLQSIDEHRRIERLGYDLRTQQLWLGRIGFEMQLRREAGGDEDQEEEVQEILVEGADVRRWVIDEMYKKNKKAEDAEIAATEFIDEICRRSGLLLPRGEDLYAFTHLSFQEFFAAVFLVPQFVRPARSGAGVKGAGRDDLNGYAASPVWQECLVFLVELIYAEQPDWLEELLYCLFGEEFAEIAPPVVQDQDEAVKALKPVARRTHLLARLAIDPHAGLDAYDLKWDAIELCCSLHACEQKENDKAIERRSPDFIPEIAKTLLDCDANELVRVWDIFTTAMNEAEVNVLSLAQIRLEKLPDFNFEQVRTLTLAGSHLSDLAALEKASNLERLSLSGMPISDIRSLSSLSNLEWLSLDNTQVSDLDGLSSLSNLLSLSLDNTQVSDLGGLSSLSNLRTLYLDNTQVSDLGGLSSLSNLRTLYLDNTQVSDLGGLSSLSNLEWLSLSNTQVSDLDGLSSLSNLWTLYLDNTQVSDLGGLSSLSNLLSLYLFNTQVSDLGGLSSLSNLRTLSLSNTQVSDLGGLSSLSNLLSLSLDNKQVSKAQKDQLKKALPQCTIY